VSDGETLFEEKCASCHGSFGEGEGQWPKLAGGEGSLKESRPTKTIGSYWPYASTLWDYIHRAMPFTAPQSLKDDDVYALTAYILYLNEIIEDDFVLSKKNFSQIKMPNEKNFYVDDRPDTQNKRCMKQCRNLKNLTIIEGSAYTISKPPTSKSTNLHLLSQKKPKSIEEKILAKAIIVYNKSCKVCHNNGMLGAPKLGNIKDWSQRLKQPKALIYQHAIKGFKSMPAKGGNLQLDALSVQHVVDYMLDSVKNIQ
jgi:cytochrome c